MPYQADPSHGFFIAGLSVIAGLFVIAPVFFIAALFVIAGLTRNPVVVWRWIPDVGTSDLIRGRDDKLGDRDDKPGDIRGATHCGARSTLNKSPVPH